MRIREREASDATSITPIFRDRFSDDVNLSGSDFQNVNMSGCSFDDLNMSGWRIHNVNLAGLKI